MAALVITATTIGGEGASGADPSCPDSDANNSSGSAEVLTGSVIDRSICGNEHDWFSIAVDTGDLVSVDLFTEAGAGEIDMTLKSSSLATLVAAAENGDVESIRYEAPQAATLLVDVFERGGDADAEYSIFSSAAPAGPCGVDEDAFEPNDVRADATAFGSDGPRQAWVCDGPDVFEIRVPPSSPGPLTATVTLASGAGDLDVGLYDESGGLVDSSTGTSGTETVEVSAPATAGSYFVEVYGYEGASGGYTLEVEGASTATVVHGVVTTWDPSSRREATAEGAVVAAHTASTEGEVAAATTDSAGEFEFDFGQLPAGSYRFAVSDPNGGWVSEWYDRASGHGSATTVPVTATDQALSPVLVQLAIEEHPFGDVPPWVDDAVNYSSTYGIVDGVTPTTFVPSNSITRGQFVRMLYRIAGSPERCDPAHDADALFDDIGPSFWALDEVTWATCDPPGGPVPIATGTTSTTFAPSSSITRAQTARMVHRLSGEIDMEFLTTHVFDDIQNPSWWAYEAVQWAGWDPDGNGPLAPLMSGIGGNFVHDDPITRAQAASLLWRLASSQPHWGTSSAFWQDPATIPGSVLFR